MHFLRLLLNEFSPMANSNREVIVGNLNNLVDASGLTDSSFSNMLGISLRKLKYIKSGKINLSLKDIELFADFFGVSIGTLSRANLKVNPNLRQKLFEKYRNINEYKVHLEKTPSIVYAIRYYLLNLTEFENQLEVKNIRLFLEEKMGWKYSSSALSNSLKRENDKIKIEPHPSKKGTLVYSKR